MAPQLESAAVKDQGAAPAIGETERMEAALAELLLSSYPAGSEICTPLSDRPGSRRYTMRVGVRTPRGGIENCVIKAGEQVELIEREAGLLRALGEVGLSAPSVIAGPVTLDAEDGVSGVLVMSELRGQPLPWFGTTSLAEADLACRLTIRGVLRLHQLTEAVRRHGIASALPHVTLSSELEEIRERGGEWWRTDLFIRAAGLLSGRLADAEVPLVFSNGDYNPLNFLHEAEALTGWIDFEHACFEDPHVGFVKFLLWSLDVSGWGTGVRAGLVERYLYAQNVSRGEFAVRLVLRGLRHLQREVSVNNVEDALQRRHMLGLLEEGIMTLEAGPG